MYVCLYVIYFLYIGTAIIVYVQNLFEVQSDLAALLLFWHILVMNIVIIVSIVTSYVPLTT